MLNLILLVFRSCLTSISAGDGHDSAYSLGNTVLYPAPFLLLYMLCMYARYMCVRAMGAGLKIPHFQHT